VTFGIMDLVRFSIRCTLAFGAVDMVRYDIRCGGFGALWYSVR